MEIKKISFKHVLYATDFSENAKRACSYAKSIADQYDAEITLLHVIKEELPDLLIFDAGNERSPIGVTKRLSLQKDHIDEKKDTIISNIKSEYCSKEIAVNEVIIEKGNPAKIIPKVAEEKNCDLIVMGVQGRSTMEDALMGNTVRRVINRSKIPVLIIQQEDEEIENIKGK